MNHSNNNQYKRISLSDSFSLVLAILLLTKIGQIFDRAD